MAGDDKKLIPSIYVGEFEDEEFGKAKILTSWSQAPIVYFEKDGIHIGIEWQELIQKAVEIRRMILNDEETLP